MATNEEAVAAAKQLEVDGREFYLKKAESASAAPIKAMFASLADDEKNHLEWLEDMAPGVESAPSANKELYGKLQQVFKGAEAEVAAGGATSDIEAIDVAIGMEEKSIEAYQAWATGGATDEIKKLGEVLTGLEKFHRQLLENAKEYLEKPGDWFLQSERWNFEGG